MAKTIKTRLLFRDPTIQRKGVSSCVRYVTVSHGAAADPRQVGAHREYVALLKAHPELKDGLRVYPSDFKPTKIEAYCLVWELGYKCVACVLPKWALSNPRLIGGIAYACETGKGYGRVWSGMQDACAFAEGKPGIRTFHYLRSHLSGDWAHPFVRLLRVPCAYVDAKNIPGGKAEGVYSFCEPVPFTFFDAGSILCREDGTDPVRSKHSPDEAFFVDDKRSWIG